MALKITRAEEPLGVSRIVMTLMGEPGVGKTSTAFTATKPLLLDCDKGAYRASNRGDSVQVETWTDIAEITPEDLADYETVILDTGGRALDHLSAHIISIDGKMARKSGALTLQGYGALKTIFKTWLDRLITTCDVDVVILAHAVEENRDEQVKVRVDMQGGSRDEIYKMSDQLGFLSMVNQRRWLSYDPSEAGFGKNAGMIEAGWVPHPSESPTLLGDHITQLKRHLNEATEAQKQETERLAQLQEYISKIGTAEELTVLVLKMIETKAKRPDRKMAANRAEELGFAWDAGEKEFKALDEETEPEATEDMFQEQLSA